MTSLIRISMAALLAAGLAACASDPDATAQTGAGGFGAGAGGSFDPRSAEYFNVTVGDRVFFAFDSSALDATARDTLIRQAQWLNENPSVTATIEGHADERGTREYNLALGARRAEAARAFLLSQGVAANRLQVVSFGKERPVALGSDEQSWAQNRRAVTVVVGAPVS